MRALMSVCAVLVLASGGCPSGEAVDTPCDGCRIDGVCFPSGVSNPVNLCERCDAALSTTAWAPLTGTPCDDGLFCNGADQCANGVCAAHAGTPCPDDGLFCNGVEGCDEFGRSCTHAGDPCADPLICNETTDVCGVDCAGCLIADVCHADGTINPANPCERCDVADEDDDWSARDGASCDDDLFCTGEDVCAGPVCLHAPPCGGDTVCRESIDRCCAPGVVPVCGGDNDVVLLDGCDVLTAVVKACEVCVGNPGEGGGPAHCACNPVAQTGCSAGEKCAFADGVTTCVAAGATAEGQACTVPTSGADSCVAGTQCVGGRCAEICSTNPDSCPTGASCARDGTILADVADTGTCAPACDPVLQDCAGDQGCYLVPVTGVSTCTAVPAGSVGVTQDDHCFGVNNTSCFINGCDKGYGANLPDNHCAFFCTPIDNVLGNTPGLAGDPAGIPCTATFGGARPDGPGAGYECRYLQSLYSNTQDVPATVGLCMSVATFGTCADFDLAALRADVESGAATASDYCDVHPDRCMLDCVSLATGGTIF